MKIMNITYKPSFGALVPKSQYSGVPRLSQETINQIKQIREIIKKHKKQITDIENQISMTSDSGHRLQFLKEKLQMYNNSKSYLEGLIGTIRKEGTVRADVHYDDSSVLNEQIKVMAREIGEPVIY